jgi:hypothetical protein
VAFHLTETNIDGLQEPSGVCASMVHQALLRIFSPRRTSPRPVAPSSPRAAATAQPATLDKMIDAFLLVVDKRADGEGPSTRPAPAPARVKRRLRIAHALAKCLADPSENRMPHLPESCMGANVLKRLTHALLDLESESAILGEDIQRATCGVVLSCFANLSADAPNNASAIAHAAPQPVAELVARALTEAVQMRSRGGLDPEGLSLIEQHARFALAAASNLSVEPLFASTLRSTEGARPSLQAIARISRPSGEADDDGSCLAVRRCHETTMRTLANLKQAQQAATSEAVFRGRSTRHAASQPEPAEDTKGVSETSGTASPAEDESVGLGNECTQGGIKANRKARLALITGGVAGKEMMRNSQRGRFAVLPPLSPRIKLGKRLELRHDGGIGSI